MSESAFDDFFDLLIDHLGLEEAEESSADTPKNVPSGGKNDIIQKSGGSALSYEISKNGELDIDDDIDNQQGKEEEEDFGLASASTIRPPPGKYVVLCKCFAVMCCTDFLYLLWSE